MNEYIYEIKSESYKYSKIHPKLEIMRSKIIKKIFDRFYDILSIHNKRFDRVKSEDFITRFIWRNISNIDPVIPVQNNYDYTQLKIDLKNYNFQPEIIIEELAFDKIIKIYLKSFDEFYNSINYDQEIEVKDTGTELFYEFEYVKYNNTIMEKFNKFFNGKFHNKLALFFCVLLRYSILDSKNQQLAISIPFKNDLKKYFKVNIELFGSSSNRFFDNFCSLFTDLEQYFGSLGNFFNVTPIQGLYMSNPPYDEELMEYMAKHLILSLDLTKKPLGFIITIQYGIMKQLVKLLLDV